MQDQIDIGVLKVVVSKLDETLEKISESTVSVQKLLAVHDERIAGLEKDNADTNQEVRELYNKMEDRTKEILHKMDDVESRIEKKISDSKEQSTLQHAALSSKVDKLDGRLSELEKWKWYVVGGLVLLGYIVTNVDKVHKLLAVIS